MEYKYTWEEIKFKNFKNFEKVLNSYKKFGFIVIDNVLNEKEISNLNSIYNEISSLRKKRNLNPFISHLMPHTWDNRILDIAKKNSIVNLVEKILGGKSDLLHSQITFKPPGDKGFSIHQDNFYNRAEPVDSMTAVWLAIDDSDKKNGALIVYPFTQKGDILSVRKNWIYILKKFPIFILNKFKQVILRDKNGYHQTSGVVEQFANTILPEGSTSLSLSVKSGGLVFMHGNLVHSSGRNSSKRRFRRNLLLNYIRRGSKFKKGFLSKRKAIDLKL